MDALKSSSPSFAVVYCDPSFKNPRAFLSPSAWNQPVPSPKLESRFLASGKSISPLQKLIRSVNRSSPILVGLEGDIETAGINDNTIPATNQTKTVHVKFLLRKQCQFGEHFLLTGEDPMFGLWEPADAVPLEWSDGDVWSLELDLPVGKTIQFKFLLKGKAGDIQWQPDPDRTISTWNTDKTIVVLEDWENSSLQQITEEEVAETLTEKLVIESEEPMLIPMDIPGDNSAIESSFSETITESNGRALTNDNNTNKKDEMILAVNEEAPVLVPGLAPETELGKECQVTEEASNGRSGIAYTPADEAIECHKKEFYEEHQPETSKDSHLQEEKTIAIASCNAVPEEKSLDDGPREVSDAPQEISQPTESTSDVMKSDISWGHKRLQKFFLSLGFFS